jgi:cytochrome c
MKRLAAGLLVLVLAAFGAMAGDETKGGTPDEAKAMVKKAVAYYKKVGREKALPEFCKTDGPFVDRDIYVTVIALDGMELAHINPKTVGKNVMDLRDPDGKFFIRERLETAKKAASGWQEFKFFNPVSKKIEPKMTYWERVDDLVFASGAYKPL